jgi:hypothetical protein
MADLTRRNRWSVAFTPLPFPATPRASQGVAGTVHKYWEGPPFRLVIFGYIGQNRRLESVLKALALSPDRGRFRLDIYGELVCPEQVKEWIRGLGIDELVKLHGFVREAELEAALASAHLAINLRFPTMGEASASQLRIWNHALPSLVTPVGWYAGLPEAAVDFVRPEAEIQDLQTHFKAFLTNPSAFAAKGQYGRRVLEEFHGPEAYAAAILRFAGEVQDFRSRSMAWQLTERVASELSGWRDSQVAGHGVSKVADEIFQMTNVTRPKEKEGRNGDDLLTRRSTVENLRADGRGPLPGDRPAVASLEAVPFPACT